MFNKIKNHLSKTNRSPQNLKYIFESVVIYIMYYDYLKYPTDSTKIIAL